MRSRPLQAAILALAVALVFLAGGALAASFDVGETVPDLTLSALGGGDRTLSGRDAPTVLIFFRGVW